MGCLGTVANVALPIAGAVIGNTLVPGAGGYLGGALVGSMAGSSIAGYEAAGEAADIGAKSAGEATNAQLEMYYKSREDMAPWREVGGRALSALEETALGGPGEFIPEEQPGYKFGYKEFVEKPLLKNASATGRLRSGNILRELSDRAQGYASMSYDNWLNRWLTKMQPLQSLAGAGQTSASTTANAGVQTGQGMAQNILAGGSAAAGGIINRANAITGGVQGISNTLMDAVIANKIMGGSLFGKTPLPQTYIT